MKVIFQVFQGNICPSICDTVIKGINFSVCLFFIPTLVEREPLFQIVRREKNECVCVALPLLSLLGFDIIYKSNN